MRIAIFTNNYLPNPFGVSMSIESFRREFEKCGHVVYIFAPKTKGYVDENKNVFRYPSIDINYKINFPLGIPFSPSISKKLEELEIDIIHSQHPNLLGWVAKRWAKKKNVPLVFTWHTLYDKYSHFAPPFIPQKIAQWWTINNAVKYANSAEQVITPTPSVKKIIQGWGVTNPNIAAIPTGVEAGGFEGADRGIIRKKYSIDKDKVLLIWIARFTDEKNVRFLFRSIIKVLKKDKDRVFLAGGDGYLFDDMKKMIEESGIESQVIMPGFIPNNEKKNYYAAGDIYVNASMSETQGMVISEAMYSGLPIIAVAATGISDQVMNGSSGFLVNEDEDEFSKAVEKLAGDDELRRRFSENSRKIALENYTDKICAQRMLEVYRKTIKTK